MEDKQALIKTLDSLKLFGIIMALDGTITHANAYTHQLLFKRVAFLKKENGITKRNQEPSDG
jgi:hypothetical protein